MKLIKNQKILVLILLIALSALVFIALERTNRTNFFQRESTTVNPQSASTTSNSKTAQDNFRDGNERQAGNSLGENKGSATITEGVVKDISDSDKAISSSSGDITVYSPQLNSQISSGVSIYGTSELDIISFRIIDSVSGVISMGELSVKDGKFSGVLELNTTAGEGRIDFYATKQDGTEFSNIEIPVRFK